MVHDLLKGVKDLERKRGTLW